jgi:hypothetical protein
MIFLLDDSLLIGEKLGPSMTQAIFLGSVFFSFET